MRLQRSANASDVWLDARCTLESYQLAPREQLEYRILERNVDIVSRDGRATRSVTVSERDRVADMTLAVFRVVPELVVHSDDTQSDVVILESDQFLAHYSLPLSASYTLLSDKPLAANASDDEVRAHVSLYALLPSFEGELRIKTSGGLRKWHPRHFLLQMNQLLVFKKRGDRTPQSTTSVLEARSVRRADPSECSDRRRHGCAVRLDTVHGALVMEAATSAEGDRVLALLSKWIALAAFFRNRFRFASPAAAPPPAAVAGGGGGTIVLDPMLRPLSPRAASSPSLSQRLAPSAAAEPTLAASSFFAGGGDDDDDPDSMAPLPDDLSQQGDDASGARATITMSNASAMMVDRNAKAPASTMRNIEIANEMTVAITLSDDVPIHLLVPIIAKQIKSDNITPLTAADLEPTSPVALLDHYLSLGAHQLPFDASLSLKDNGGAKPGVRDENRYAASNVHVLVFARLPSICERVAVRKGVSKKRLWLELCGMHLRCYTDTSAAAIDEMSTLRNLRQHAATLRRADNDVIDKIEYLNDDAGLDDGQDELDEIAQVEKELAAMKVAAAANAAAGGDDRGELVGELHVSNIEFVSTDVKNSKSFKIMLRRPPLGVGLLPSRALAPPLADNADLSYTFVCDDVEVKLDWYELLNDWLPFFQSYRDTEASAEPPRTVAQPPRGLLGEDIYTASELKTYATALAAATQRRHIMEVSLDPHDDKGDAGTAAIGPDAGTRKVINRAIEPLAVTRPPPSPTAGSASPRSASPASESPVLAPAKPARAMPVAPIAAVAAAGAPLPAAPLPAARAAAPASPSLRRMPAAARQPQPALAPSPRLTAVQSNYIKFDADAPPAAGSPRGLPPPIDVSPTRPPPAPPAAADVPPSRPPPVADVPPSRPPPVAPSPSPSPSSPALPPARGVALPPAQRLPPPVAARQPPQPQPAARQMPPISAARSAPALPAARSALPPPPAQQQQFATMLAPMPPQDTVPRSLPMYDAVPAEPSKASEANKTAFRTGKPKFNVPPGDGTHEDPQRQAKFKELVKSHLTKYAWYSATMTREQAESKLRGMPDKTFVVRNSRVPHCLALSHVAGGKVVHVVLEFWDCDERRGWCKEDGKTIAASVSALLATLDFVDMTKAPPK